MVFEGKWRLRLENDAFDAGGSGSLHDLKIKPSLGCSPQQLLTLNAELLDAIFITSRLRWFQLSGMMRYASGFMAPFWTALQYFSNFEKNGSKGNHPPGSASDFIELLLFETQLAARGAMADIAAISKYHIREMLDALAAIENTLLKKNDEDLLRFSQRQLRLMDMTVNIYPDAVREIESEFGFHFDNGRYVRVAETDRFELY